VARLPILLDTLLPAQAEDVVELDEVVSFVGEKWFKRWLWLAMCRRTRQIVAYAIGDRSETTAQKLWQALPET
jgi:insertion element IS1 protein InsB